MLWNRKDLACFSPVASETLDPKSFINLRLSGAHEPTQFFLLFYNILSDCHYSDVINMLLNAFMLKKGIGNSELWQLVCYSLFLKSRQLQHSGWLGVAQISNMKNCINMTHVKLKRLARGAN